MFPTQLGQDSIFVLPAENQTLFVLFGRVSPEVREDCFWVGKAQITTIN